MARLSTCASASRSIPPLHRSTSCEKTRSSPSFSDLRSAPSSRSIDGSNRLEEFTFTAGAGYAAARVLHTHAGGLIFNTPPELYCPALERPVFGLRAALAYEKTQSNAEDHPARHLFGDHDRCRRTFLDVHRRICRYRAHRVHAELLFGSQRQHLSGWIFRSIRGPYLRGCQQPVGSATKSGWRAPDQRSPWRHSELSRSRSVARRCFGGFEFDCRDAGNKDASSARRSHSTHRSDRFRRDQKPGLPVCAQSDSLRSRQIGRAHV